MTHAQALLTAEEQFSDWILFFFAYSFLGWIWESCYVSVKQRKWISSGFLNGPIIPIYGFSITAILAAVAPFEKNIWVLYLAGVVIVSVIEYIISWGMEKLFHARWWDYSKVPLNINGRVAIPVSLFWGIGIVFVIKVIHPMVARWVAHISQRYGMFSVMFLIGVGMFDFGLTLASLPQFREATQKIGDTIAARKAQLRADLQDANAELSNRQAWLDSFKQEREAEKRLPNVNYIQRRLLHSFPNLNLNDTKTEAKDISQLVDLLQQRRKQK